jgi:hypothetical protein
MVVVDTHCHASPYWYEPVETLLDQMNRHGVAKATLIQIGGEYDNAYLIRVHHDLGYTVPFTKGGTAHVTVWRSSHTYDRRVRFDELDCG